MTPSNDTVTQSLIYDTRLWLIKLDEPLALEDFNDALERCWDSSEYEVVARHYFKFWHDTYLEVTRERVA